MLCWGHTASKWVRFELRDDKAFPQAQGGSDRERGDLWFAAEGGLLLENAEMLPRDPGADVAKGYGV